MSTILDRCLPFESEYHLNRRMANKYGLDFEHRCCFLDMVEHIAPGLRERYGEQLLNVKMVSGKTALYAVEMGGYYSDTGQHDWKFTFQKYLP